MNDFTKEELEEILNWGEVYTEFGNCWTYRVLGPLIIKIQSMIDSYCEHEFAKYPDGITAIPYCTKCRSMVVKKDLE